MISAVIAEIIENFRSIRRNFTTDFALTVQNTHGIFIQPVIAGRAETVLFVLKILYKRAAVLGAAGLAAYGIYFKLQTADTNLLEKSVRQ